MSRRTLNCRRFRQLNRLYPRCASRRKSGIAACGARSHHRQRGLGQLSQNGRADLTPQNRSSSNVRIGPFELAPDFGPNGVKVFDFHRLLHLGSRAGHLSTLEQPTRFNMLLEDFLSRLPARSYVPVPWQHFGFSVPHPFGKCELCILSSCSSTSLACIWSVQGDFCIIGGVD